VLCYLIRSYLLTPVLDTNRKGENWLLERKASLEGVGQCVRRHAAVATARHGARNCASSIRGDKHLRVIFISGQSLGSVHSLGHHSIIIRGHINKLLLIILLGATTDRHSFVKETRSRWRRVSNRKATSDRSHGRRLRLIDNNIKRDGKLITSFTKLKSKWWRQYICIDEEITFIIAGWKLFIQW